MKKPTSAITLNGKPLIPAPFVSTSYEYKSEGKYVIGGFLIVNLDGTLVGKDIVNQMADIGSLQSGLNCVALQIGCEGSPDFLSGSGRVRSVSLSASDQPFIANYTIVVALETVDGRPAVPPDPEFLRRYCLTEDQTQYIMSYNETLTFDGGESVALVDNELGVSKSFVKVNGQITVTTFAQEICGVPDYSGIDTGLGIVQSRAASLMSLGLCNDSESPLSAYALWNKWLDSKSIVVNDTGSVEWKFDLYLSLGQCAPYAWVDLNTDDKSSYQTGSTPQQTRSINGTIKGLCFSTVNILDSHPGSGERLANANRALNILLPRVITGTWPAHIIPITGGSGERPPDDENSCGESEKEEFCYQRLSSTITTKAVAGEITFSAEFGNISACKSNGSTEELIDVTIDETLPSSRHIEHIIPNIGKSIIQYLGDKPAEATVTVRGSLQGCDKTKHTQVIGCVDAQFNKSTAKYRGWIVRENNVTISTFSYSRTQSFIRCN
jgi:hypothetical protein